jgi:hypothetical protein
MYGAGSIGVAMSRRPAILLIPLILLLVAGCSGVRAPWLEATSLFALRYGKMENQVELRMGTGAVRRKTTVHMRGGIVLVASGYGNRIMEFTSYGDLLALYYNDEENPEPVLLASTPDPSRVANRRAYRYPFNAVGEIAVTSTGGLLVEDLVPERVAVFDPDLGVILNRTVVRFDSQGNPIDYLGQEGIGGTFFPYVQRIEVTSNDEIVVVTSAPPRSLVYWYSPNGRLLRRVEISPETLPVAEDRTAFPVLGAIFPDRELYRLYLQLHYPPDLNGGGVNHSSDSHGLSRVYWLDIEDGTYQGFFDVPTAPEVSTGSSFDGTLDSQYELIGTGAGEHLFLLAQQSMQQSQLLILNTSGKVVRRRTIDIDYDEVVYRDLYVSDGGILTGLMANRDNVEIVWWRTDKLYEAR